jgi:nitrite reductase (NADH) large subunit
MAEPLLIIGKGMAATRLVDALSRRALGRYAIAVVGAEPSLAYNRVLLSSLLAGEIARPELELKPATWWASKGVTTLYGQKVMGIDRTARQVTLADGKVLPYGKLVLATGSAPIRLPISGADKAGVITFRDLADVAVMQATAKATKRAIVIGGGLLGLEAAYGLARGGAKVTLVHLMDRLMERQLDGEAAGLLAGAMRGQGIEIVLEASTAAITGADSATGITLADGRHIAADLIVLAAGIRPQVELAEGCGLAVNRGIVVDDGLVTSDPDVFAIGECAEHRGVVYGLVEPAYEQAEVLARQLTARDGVASPDKPPRNGYLGSVVATNLKVSGINVFSAGDFLGGAGTQSLVLRDRSGTYKKLVLRDGRLAGAVLYGETGDALWYLDLIRRATPIASMRSDMIFGRALVERLHAATHSKVGTLPVAA